MRIHRIGSFRVNNSVWPVCPYFDKAAFHQHSESHLSVCETATFMGMFVISRLANLANADCFAFTGRRTEVRRFEKNVAIRAASAIPR